MSLSDTCLVVRNTATLYRRQPDGDQFTVLSDEIYHGDSYLPSFKSILWGVVTVGVVMKSSLVLVALVSAVFCRCFHKQPGKISFLYFNSDCSYIILLY